VIDGTLSCLELRVVDQQLEASMHNEWVQRRNNGGHHRRLHDGRLTAVYKITATDCGGPLLVDVTVGDVGPTPGAVQRVRDEHTIVSG
jgi:hypothetical protein